ncbi:leucine-rich repeat-containing protein 41 [Scomber scombrus]|uniref:Leucine-rich repeat-containing protein 41 n=1 Tax=Scomber scombrus TaxID=13677 RepID=A0AAV1PRW5_SCOSC
MQADKRKPEEITLCLKKICLQAVRKHFAAVGAEAVVGDLPTPLLEDLLPHLTVCQLDELQPALNLKGISTYSGWIRILEDMCGCAADRTPDFLTEEAAKHEVMRTLFTVVFNGFTNTFVNRNITNLNTPSFLRAAAKCIKHFLLFTGMHKPLKSLTAEQRPLLNLLEQCIRSVGVSQSADLSKKKTQTALYVLHRLLDHGVAKELVVHVKCPLMLAWLLHGRGSQYVNCKLKKLMHSKRANCVSRAVSTNADEASCSPGLETLDNQDDEVTPCKRSRLDSACVEAAGSVDPQVICGAFTPCGGPPAEACPWGKIEHLEIRQCGSDSLTVLNSALLTFFCLRSLTLHSTSTFSVSDVLGLAGALKQLSGSSHSSLTDLSVSVLPNIELMDVLLDTNPSLTSLSVEFQTDLWEQRLILRPPLLEKSELALEKLTVKVAHVQTDVTFITSVLRRCPHLTSLHVAGMRLPTGSSQSQLLTTLSESNPCLRSLTLEDLNLSDCLHEILNLLRCCKLEELQFNDCRLLEKWSDKQQSLQQLVSALKTVSTLHTLSMAQNRLAKSVCVLAELFSGSSPSSVNHIDISSNFIQAAELLEFSEALRTHCPPHRLTLDLRKNPGDRDPDTWNTALRRLRPLCVLLVEGWKSTNTMADHISNM